MRHPNNSVSPVGEPSRSRCRGDRPRAAVKKTPSLHVGRGPVLAMHRSRGKPARMRVWHPRAPARRSLKRSRGTGPRPTVARTVSFTVGRGPVPRHAPIAGETHSDARMETSEGPRATEPETIAGDRPPRYGSQNGSLSRRARACPSPCCGLTETRGGQAPALR